MILSTIVDDRRDQRIDLMCITQFLSPSTGSHRIFASIGRHQKQLTRLPKVPGEVPAIWRNFEGLHDY